METFWASAENCCQTSQQSVSDDSDQKFLDCESACVDKFYKPDVQESELGDLEKCAENCLDVYRGEILLKQL